MNTPNFKSRRPFHNAAQEYLDKGWQPIYLAAGDKFPPPRGMTGGPGLITDRLRLEKWLSGEGEPDKHGEPTSVDAAANIALRLGIPLPLQPGEDVATCVIGIDVDNYLKKGEAKNGGRQLADLEAEIGTLPATYTLTSRYSDWRQGTDAEHLQRGDVLSGIRLYRIPIGVQLHEGPMACPDIEFVQFHHRYAVTWPSRFEGRTYEIIWCSENSGDTEPVAGVPEAVTVPLLPKSWLSSDKIVKGIGRRYDREIVSQLKPTQLKDWAKEHLPKPIGDNEIDDVDCARDYENKYGVPMCRRIGNAVDKFIKAITEEEHSHDPMTDMHWEIVTLAAEGHLGWQGALEFCARTWIEDVLRRDKRNGIDEATGELGRSVTGALSKVEPDYVKPKWPGGICCWSKSFATREANRLGISDFGENMRAIKDERPEELGDVVGHMRLKQALEDALDDNDNYRYPRNDIGNAQHMIDMYGDSVRYVHGQGRWILWSKGRWHRDTYDGHMMAAAFQRVRNVLEAYAREIGQQVQAALASGDAQAIRAARARHEKWNKWATEIGNRQRIRNAINVSETVYWHGQPVRIDARDVDSDKHMLGCADGVIHLTDHGAMLHKARKDDYVTRNTDTPWVRWPEMLRESDDEGYGYTEWKQYLDTFLPSDELQRWAQMLLGYSLIGGNDERAVIFFYGQSSTGKSTMINCLEEALGEYAETGDLSIFQQSTFNSVLLEAMSARVLMLDEVEGQRVSTAKVKELAGGTTLKVQIKNKNETYSGRPDFTVIIGTNHAPELPDADDAIDRRFYVVPFKVVMPKDKEQSTKLTQLGKRCRIAILSWLVEGYDMYVRNGKQFPEAPEEAKIAKQELRSEFNATSEFAADCCEMAPPNVHAAVQYVARKYERRNGATYKDWTEADGQVGSLARQYVIDQDEFVKQYGIWYKKHYGADYKGGSNKITRELGAHGVTVGKRRNDEEGGKPIRVYLGVRITEYQSNSVPIKGIQRNA